MILKTISIFIAGASGAMILLTWGTPAATAWAVAFAGWIPHAFRDTEVNHGNS
jgi:hypothetical protein